MSALPRAAGLAYRESGGRESPPVLFLHGYPESSYMWRDAIAATAGAGMRAIAPDFAGYGDSPADPPGTWEHHVEMLDAFVRELELGPVALVTHDWGVMIGLRWACDTPGSARALVISDGGFFADRRWHDLANTLRTPGDGEALVDSMTREAFGAALAALVPAIEPQALDEYFRCCADAERRRGQLELYRSGDFEKLAPYEGALAALGVPTLLLWGELDPFAPVALGERFRDELPGSTLSVIDGAGHFIWDEASAQATALLVPFLVATAGD
ncbi:MAG TPA: alpha/beta fold hydrolase [Solirubrobacteraceae bacterium]|nr:alpha/beta fold hydrolase [Solirubrobacteraceae bacterium]